MGAIDDFGRAIGDGISTIFGRAFEIIGGTWAAIATAASTVLPGPLLPVAIVAAIVVFVWLVFRS